MKIYRNRITKAEIKAVLLTRENLSEVAKLLHLVQHYRNGREWLTFERPGDYYRHHRYEIGAYLIWLDVDLAPVNLSMENFEKYYEDIPDPDRVLTVVERFDILVQRLVGPEGRHLTMVDVVPELLSIREALTV